ncbi:uncharacterized protein K452DRAFT_359492 [Aplosporella prunicola CBS 121167]|uniref:Extracellular membrane protein CFEM domain-containing protein n=1 Tax=Aplosporella prunicola CBS 121167 TaxID=1176127 RepID=A0A6A6BAK4_9PEZI|nr:uncharacterized protein K452DRAFT_359492 [Aplosporella prunicola CBS 121167]KAF2141120.1 hypothetical protein K452DRAFT_359492 [Aplosporella prunicola CBS 121167]
MRFFQVLSTVMTFMSVAQSFGYAPGPLDTSGLPECMAQCMRSNEDFYDISKSTARKFCETNLNRVSQFIRNRIIPCADQECPNEQWQTINGGVIPADVVR